MPGRTWAVSPDASTLERRWQKLQQATDAVEMEKLFHPQLRKGVVSARHIRKFVNESLGAIKTRETPIIDDKDKLPDPIRYGFRSFDRHWLPSDSRLLNDPRPRLWAAYGDRQIFATALMASSPKSGPALTLTSLIPDQDHYKGSFGGRVFPLWKDAAATEANISSAILVELTKAFGTAPDPTDVFAYVAGLLAHPAYTTKFASDLVRPGLRVPVTADAKLFAEAAALGREVIWLHTFGERFNSGKPAGPPRVTPNGPNIPKEGAISAKPEDFPDSIDYDVALKRLKIGTGFIDNVPPAVWSYEVSGKNVLRQWFSYRKKNRERPVIGDKRKPSPLGDIQPDHWLPEYSSELINVLNVLTMLLELEPRQADLLDRICDGALIPASKLAS